MWNFKNLVNSVEITSKEGEKLAKMFTVKLDKRHPAGYNKRKARPSQRAVQSETPTVSPKMAVQ